MIGSGRAAEPDTINLTKMTGLLLSNYMYIIIIKKATLNWNG